MKFPRLHAPLACAALCASAPLSAQAVLDANGEPDPAYPGFHAWYDARDGVNGAGQPSAGSAVTSWVDRTGKGHDLVRVDADLTRQATYQDDVLQGHPAVLFDGDDYLWGDGVGEFGTLDGAKSFFVVARADQADGGYVFDSSSASGRNALFSGQTSAPGVWHVYAGQNPVTVGPAVQAGVWHTHSVVFDASSNRHFLDGALVASGSVATQSMVGLILGSRYTVSSFLTGAIAEVLVYDETLSAADRSGIESYLAAKWFTPPDLSADVDSVSLGSGGAQNFSLDAGVDFAGKSYLLLGSTSGTAPGFPLDGSVLPLNVDDYLIYTLNNPNAPPLSGSLGFLDAAGQAQASLAVPPGLPAGLAGLVLHHAYVVIEATPSLLAVVHASQAVPLLFLP